MRCIYKPRKTLTPAEVISAKLEHLQRNCLVQDQLLTERDIYALRGMLDMAITCKTITEGQYTDFYRQIGRIRRVCK